MICASTTVVNPCETPKLTNSRKRDTPVIISAFIIGIALAKFITWRVRDRRLKIPIAAILPNSVETVAAIIAMANVFHNALTNERCTPPVNSELYNLVENPVQFPKTFASVNEKIIIIRIGEYSSTNSSHKYPFAIHFVIISHLPLRSKHCPLHS